MPPQKPNGVPWLPGIVWRLLRRVTDWLVSWVGTAVPSFTIRNARESDFDQLYDFVFDKPDPNVLRRSRQEVGAMVDEGVFFIAIREDTGRIVGSCYLKGSEETGQWEFGGAYVEPQHRTHGLFRCLALASMISHFTGEPDTSLIAHVVSGNPGPVKVLESLMFRRIKERDRFSKSSFVGIEHMMADADGFVYADTYEFQRDRLISLIYEAEAFPREIVGKDGVARPVHIMLRAFEDSEILYNLRTHLERANTRRS